MRHHISNIHRLELLTFSFDVTSSLDLYFYPEVCLFYDQQQQTHKIKQDRTGTTTKGHEHMTTNPKLVIGKCTKKKRIWF